mmetsp:Transcript_21584/g.56256  ORF Transcript_21584/g.56256 Transcript_21584/m.56256 type:complete len:515 (-) Transcript_21584:295-1839(-)
MKPAVILCAVLLAAATIPCAASTDSRKNLEELTPLEVTRSGKLIVKYSSESKKASWPEKYKIANPLEGEAEWWPYRGESFEIYSNPIPLKYAQVAYQFHTGLLLPEDFRKRFHGKDVAFTGYEINVVRFDEDSNEESVPSFDAYNHHYVIYMKGANWTDECTGWWCPPGGLPSGEAANLGQVLRRSSNDHLNIQMFSEGNGNEHRGSFHGYPKGFSQILHSPHSLDPFFHLINTRGGGGRGGVGSSLLPRSSNAKPDARYSGLIECPCTTRRQFDLEKLTIDGKAPEMAFGACRQEIAHQNNPSCELETYRGGLRCCGDQMVLLDEDQEDAPGLDVFYFKMRWWFEDPAKVPSKNLFRMFWETEDRNNEYDIPQCAPKSKSCVHTLINRFTVKELCEVWTCGDRPVGEEGFDLIFAGPHLHVGGISMELINADTGEQLCIGAPEYGDSDEARNEEGYVTSIPPCLWSHEDPGLPSPPRLFNETRLISIAKYSTDPQRWGAMALWQMRGVYVDEE